MIQPSPSISYKQHPNITITRQVPIGKRLVIVGESSKGNLYDPTLVFDIDMAIDIFGDGPLIDAYEDATTYQEDLNVFLMRVEKENIHIAFSVLESFHFDLLFMSDVHFNEDTNLLHEFIRFAYTKENLGNLIHGVTTLSPGLSYEDLLALRELTSSLTVDVGTETVEKGKYISLVVNQGLDKDAGAVYAGLLAALDPGTSPVNKTIPDFEIAFDFTKDQILELRSIGVVCFKNTLKKGITCTSSSCAVRTEGSVHKHVSNFRIAQVLINQLASELQHFVGQPQILLKAGQIEDVINNVCQEFQAMNRIREYDYTLSVSELYGIVEVSIEVVPIFSVHKMTVHSSVRIYR